MVNDFLLGLFLTAGTCFTVAAIEVIWRRLADRHQAAARSNHDLLAR